MTPTDTISAITEHCSLSEEWTVRQAGINTELVVIDEEPPADAAIEVIAAEQSTELVLAHPAMPTRASLLRAKETGEDPDIRMDIPATVGVLQFASGLSDDVLNVIEELADVDQLTDLAEARNPFAGDGPLSVHKAIEEHTNVPVESVDGTLTGL